MFQFESQRLGLFGRLRRYGWSTLRYLTQTEVHTYAFSVAANSLLSLCPLIVLLLTIIQAGLSFAADVQRRAAAPARLSAQQPGLCDPQPTVPGQRSRARTGVVAGDAANYLNGHLPSARSGAEQHLGVRQKPLVHHERDGIGAAGAGLRVTGAAVGLSHGART